MVADVAGKPAQDGRQVEEGAAFQGGAQRIPFRSAGPVAAGELVLDEEEGDTGRSGQPEHRQLDEQVGFQADGAGGQDGDARQGQVGEQDTRPLAAAAMARRNALAEEEGEQGAQAENHQGMPVEPVQQAGSEWCLTVFLHGQGPDVTEAA